MITYLHGSSWCIAACTVPPRGTEQRGLEAIATYIRSTLCMYVYSIRELCRDSREGPACELHACGMYMQMQMYGVQYVPRWVLRMYCRYVLCACAPFLRPLPLHVRVSCFLWERRTRDSGAPVGCFLLAGLRATPAHVFTMPRLTSEPRVLDKERRDVQRRYIIRERWAVMGRP